jgi:hypothetical protein
MSPNRRVKFCAIKLTENAHPGDVPKFVIRVAATDWERKTP